VTKVIIRTNVHAKPLFLLCFACLPATDRGIDPTWLSMTSSYTIDTMYNNKETSHAFGGGGLSYARGC